MLTSSDSSFFTMCFFRNFFRLSSNEPSTMAAAAETACAETSSRITHASQGALHNQSSAYLGGVRELLEGLQLDAAAPAESQRKSRKQRSPATDSDRHVLHGTHTSDADSGDSNSVATSSAFASFFSLSTCTRTSRQISGFHNATDLHGRFARNRAASGMRRAIAPKKQGFHAEAHTETRERTLNSA